MNRYTVTLAPDRTHWVILDVHLGGFCTLPDSTETQRPNLLPLEWRTLAAAEAWLLQCYKVWATDDWAGPPAD